MRYAQPVEPRSVGPSEDWPLRLRHSAEIKKGGRNELPHTRLAVLIMIVLIVGLTLTVMNKACKSGYHSRCAPMSTVRHHVKTRPPA